MSEEHLNQIDPARQDAVNELISIITRRYPTASFTVGPGEDNPDATYITATMDLDDPDEIVDIVINRMLELQLDQNIPVYVIPTYVIRILLGYVLIHYSGPRDLDRARGLKT